MHRTFNELIKVEYQREFSPRFLITDAWKATIEPIKNLLPTTEHLTTTGERIPTSVNLVTILVKPGSILISINGKSSGQTLEWRTPTHRLSHSTTKLKPNLLIE